MINKFMGEYRFLSNFHRKAVVYDGVTYPSNENAYMAAKTLDKEFRKKFETLTSLEARKLGRSKEILQSCGLIGMRLGILS